MSKQKSNNSRQDPLPSFVTQDEEMLSQTELEEIWARRAYELAQEPPAPATRIQSRLFNIN